MVAAPIEITVLTDEPFQASYLASVLQLELPGLFHVRHRRRDEASDSAGADLFLVQDDSVQQRNRRSLADVGGLERGAPVIVVARGTMDLASLDRLLRDGADDVLDLGQLTAKALAAAVLKAVRRHARAIAPPTSFAGRVIPAM